MKKAFLAAAIFLTAGTSAVADSGVSESPAPASKPVITKVLLAKGIDARYQPVDVMKKFPAGTSKVYCWIEWKGAVPQDRILARWVYAANQLTIFEFPVPLPLASGSGGVALAMPGSQTFPKGKYRVDLLASDQSVLKSAKFEVL